MLIYLCLPPRINTIKHNGHITMILLSNVYQGNAVKEHVGFVVLRASLAARKPNCELIMGLVTSGVAKGGPGRARPYQNFCGPTKKICFPFLCKREIGWFTS